MVGSGFTGLDGTSATTTLHPGAVAALQVKRRVLDHFSVLSQFPASSAFCLRLLLFQARPLRPQKRVRLGFEEGVFQGAAMPGLLLLSMPRADLAGLSRAPAQRHRCSLKGSASMK